MTAPVQQRTAEQLLADILDLLSITERTATRVSTQAIRDLIRWGWDQ